ESPIPAALAVDLRTIPGVRATDMARILPGMMYQGQRIAVAALSDGLLEPSRYPRSWYRSGDPAQAARAVRDGQGVNVSESFADRFAKQVGDPVDLDTPNGVLT